MTALAPWLAALGPLCLLAAGLVPAATADRHPRRMAAAALAAGIAALATAAFALAACAAHGPVRAALIYLDAVSATVLLLVSFVGTVVIRFSRNYLDGDPGQGRFVRNLALTLAAVLALIASASLPQFAIAWIVTSLCLQRLLLHYPDRPAAVLAARKKFVASRIGDACLIAAFALMARSAGTIDIAAVLAAPPPQQDAAAVLLALAALLKSAQFPLHGWLLEVMETPTPVSALLHAGIVNAGGFLLLRFAPVVAASPAALDLLVAVGGFTALFGSLVMLTQTSVKVALAWSTIAQMGFMLLQCGLGAFPAALLHLVAHSLYKAHAFLSSGSVIDLFRASWSPADGQPPHPARGALAAGMILAAGLLLRVVVPSEPGLLALATIVVLGLAHYVVSAIDERPSREVIARTVGAALIVAAVWIGLQAGAIYVTRGALATRTADAGWPHAVLTGAVVMGFAVLAVMQNAWAARPGSDALYAHVANGLYVNTLANRLAIRLWPAGGDLWRARAGRGAR